MRAPIAPSPSTVGVLGALFHLAHYCHYAYECQVSSLSIKAYSLDFFLLDVNLFIIFFLDVISSVIKNANLIFVFTLLNTKWYVTGYDGYVVDVKFLLDHLTVFVLLRRISLCQVLVGGVFIILLHIYLIPPVSIRMVNFIDLSYFLSMVFILITYGAKKTFSSKKNDKEYGFVYMPISWHLFKCHNLELKEDL